VSAPLAPGATIAPGYEVLEHLNRGLDLDVYDAWSEERDCRCAAKVLRPDRVEKLSARRRLVREGRLLKRLAHPHIVRAYELIEPSEHPGPVLVLETLMGETLAHLIAERRRRFPVPDLVCLGIHLCSAVHYLHRHGILHLDLKPSNIVAHCGVAKVLDLSIARPPGRSRRRMGTPQYMAPEQATRAPLGPAADVWGLGAVLFEAATGQRPFETQATAEGRLRYEQLERRAAPVRSLRRRLPADLAALIDRCLEREPARRPPLEELAGALKALV
jgi:serine/threonine protein kinase